MNSTGKPRTSLGKVRKLPAILLSLCLLAAGGCRVVEETVKLPARTVAAVMPGAQPKEFDPAELQSQLLRYADDFFARTSAGLDAYARLAGTAAARSEALDWKVAMDSSTLGIVTGPNPLSNLADVLAFSSLTRAFLDQRAATPQSGGAFKPWLEHSRILETNAWRIADGILSSQQQDEFRAAINQWLAANTNAGTGFFRRPQELASGIRQSSQDKGQSGSVFSLVGLDPVAGLDPAVREVTRTRLFAERALFTIERMPFLVRWHTELITDNLLGREQITNALASADRLSRAMESASQAAALLPDRITAERKAILAELEQQEGKLRELSAEVGRTLSAGDKMSASLNTTLVTFDALMKRFGVGEPKSSPPDTNSPPFSILDYAHTAEQIATMAQQLDALIKDTTGTLDTPALDKRIAQLNTLSARARADAKSVLNHAFLLLAGLVVLVFTCLFIYRSATRRNAGVVSPGTAGANPAETRKSGDI